MMNLRLSTLAILALLTVIFAMNTMLAADALRGDKRKCGRGKVYSTCATLKECDITCTNINDPPKGCPDVCVARCACPSDKPYINIVNGKETCVSSCPSKNESKTDAPTTLNDPRCRIRGMVWNTCASACPPTCFSPNPEICIAECVEQCECPKGTILNDLSNPQECVEQCPST